MQDIVLGPEAMPLMGWGTPGTENSSVAGSGMARGQLAQCRGWPSLDTGGALCFIFCSRGAGMDWVAQHIHAHCCTLAMPREYKRRKCLAE